MEYNILSSDNLLPLSLKFTEKSADLYLIETQLTLNLIVSLTASHSVLYEPLYIKTRLHTKPQHGENYV